MGLIQSFMNASASARGLAALAHFLPYYLIFKLVSYALRSLFRENVAGKVVLITGASSGIGEHLAYEYARRGACLALIARIENRLREVANASYHLGSPEVILMRADVSKVEDCERFINATVDHFVDHLVNNAGIAPLSLFEESTVYNSAPVMDNVSGDILFAMSLMQDTNFWGSVYCAYYAIPYLQLTEGRIVGIASSAAWLPAPRLSFYNASKAAILSFYETLRTEVGTTVGITIVTPGLTESELTMGKFLSKEGTMIVDQEMRDVEMSITPVQSVTRCAKVVVDSACRGDNYVTVPSWMRVTYLWMVFCPEVLQWCNRWLRLPSPGTSDTDTISKKLLDLTGAKRFVYPASIRFPEISEL